jgi:acyl carrier protein
MKIEKVFEDVKEVIEGSVGVPKEDIKLESTLFDELHVDSIDLVDILYELETLYDVELKVSDIEAKARVELGDKPYEIDGVITEDGLEAVRKHMDEIDPKQVKPGLTVNRLVQLFSVHSLCKIVMYRFEDVEN